METKKTVRGRLRSVLRWTLALLLGVPIIFCIAFVGLLEMTERQWLGRAPQNESTNVRIREPHQWALLDVGADSLSTRLRLIQEARHSIDLEFFIYELDTASRILSSALEQRAREGIKVRIIVDFARPVFKLRPVFVKKLNDAGVEVRYYNTAGLARFFAIQHRTHRKMLIVDREAAVIGGRNIGDDYFDLSSHYNFLDSDVLIRGQIVASMTDSFQLYWDSDWVSQPDAIVDNAEVSGGATKVDNHEAPEDATAKVWLRGSSRDSALVDELLGRAPMHRGHQCNDVQFVTDHPGSGVERRIVYSAIVELAEEAKERILLESPYFVMRSDGLRVIHSIVDRGVNLQILTNGLYSTDAYYTVAALVPTLGNLAREGLQLYAYTGVELVTQNGRPEILDEPAPVSRWGLHAKRAVFDDRIVAVGTYNMDPRSANLNSELMLICRDNPALAAEAAESFEQRRQQSVPVLGTVDARGASGLVQGAEQKKVLLMYAVMPVVRLFDFLL